MSKDETEDGGSLLQFPRIVMPGSFDAPGPASEPDGGDGGQPVPAGVWPSLPRVSEMGPPLALTMPGILDPGPAGAGDDEGAFTLPQPEDPANPTVRDTLAVAMALVTALGVAAAQGMWHRARHRQSLADQSRANADKAQAKAAGSRRGSKGDGGEGSSSRRSSGSSGKKGRRSSSDKSRPAGATKPPKGPRGKAPKADRSGKTDWNKSKRRKKDPGEVGAGGGRKSTKRPNTKAPKTPKKTPGKLTWKRSKGGKAKPTGWTKGRPKGAGKAAPKPKRRKPNKLSWKTPKRRPGSNGGKAITGRKRWAGRGKAKPVVKRHRKSWSRRARKSGVRLWKRWKARSRTSPQSRTFGWFAWPKRGHSRHRSARRRWWTNRPKATSNTGAWSSTRASAPPPPPGFGGMRPPPGADRRMRVKAERVYPGARTRREESAPAALAGAPARGRPALPAAVATPTNGARFVSTPAQSTQYGDAEVTVYDVIGADADMAEEILVGVDEARATADGCEVLLSRLEAVHAKIVELKVPGLLAGWMVRLMEKTGTVKARAQAIADRLPAASEAIAVAGSNAAAIYKPPADVTRDMGHTRPAEREYHNE